MVFRISFIILGCFIAGYAFATEGTQFAEAFIGGALIDLGLIRF